jgi:hypothetical protein
MVIGGIEGVKYSRGEGLVAWQRCRLGLSVVSGVASQLRMLREDNVT